MSNIKIARVKHNDCMSTIYLEYMICRQLHMIRNIFLGKTIGSNIPGNWI